MIRITAEKNSRTAEINFPCNDGYLFGQLKKIGVTDPFDCTQVIRDSSGAFPSFSVLYDKPMNLDFLNFLAKRFDSFDKRELAQFEAAQFVMKYTDIKDIINLTYNLHDFTVITDFSDIKKVGECHYLTVNMCMSAKEKESIDFRALGNQLISSGSGVVTPYGVLFENRLPCEEVFNGRTLPEYFYEDCAFGVIVSKGELTETLYLPTEELTIQKALKRLGAAGIEDCMIDSVNSLLIPDNWLDTFCADYGTLDIFAFNTFCNITGEFESAGFEKLLAVAEYADIHDLDGATRLAENIGSFLYVPDVHDAESLGKQQIMKSGSYKYDGQLEDFYNYEMFGNYLIEYQEGSFLDSGYVGIDDYDFTLSEILGDKKTDMTMGEM
ncbi:MAG: hypothetical protein PHD46_07070 [Eubacteriales bacterium]|nr:hypothetical protein [Eubacteriales bacterium]